MVLNMLSWRIHNPNFNLLLSSSSLYTTHHHTQAQSHFFKISITATTTTRKKIRLSANKTPIIDRDSPSTEEIRNDYDNDDDDVAVKKSDYDFDEEEDDDVSRIQVPKEIQNDYGDDDDDVAAKKSDDDFDKEEADDVSRIQVPREGYIPVSKADILEALVSTMFSSSQQQDDDVQDSNEVKEEEEDKEMVDQFVLLSSCLDSVIHAEHKAVLEQMRVDYQHSSEEDDKEEEDESNDSVPISDYNGGFDFKRLFSRESKKEKDGKRLSRSRVAVATRFQSAFMQLLSNAQFEELSARDLMLTSALNTDYLLTLPVYVDWKRAYKSNAIIFRRGYTIEREKGVLIGEKLDYIQSKILQRIFFLVSKPVGKVGIWITKALKNALETKEVRIWTERIKLWIKELSLIQQSSSYEEDNSDNGVDSISSRDLPMWLAAQRAVSRYEGLLSSVGPRERLLRKLLMWTGAITPTPGTPFEIYHDSSSIKPYQRPINLSRMTLDDIWRPATGKYCGNNLWKILKTSISILFSRSALQEPAFQELVLLYTEDMNEGETTDKTEVPSLQLKIYDGIPIPDLPVVFPHKKLSFRIIDTVRLDVASIIGLLAFFINYKFEDILSSPSALLLDAIALSALIIYVSRVVLGYKQTRDRYQLLVNKTLYEKTLASGFGSVHFLLDASEQQQYKEAILAYAVLLKAENSQVHCRSSVGDKCERFIYDALKVKVKMPIDKAMDTLLRLGLVTETTSNEKSIIQALPCTKAYEAIKQRWNSLLD